MSKSITNIRYNLNQRIREMKSWKGNTDEISLLAESIIGFELDYREFIRHPETPDKDDLDNYEAWGLSFHGIALEFGIDLSQFDFADCFPDGERETELVGELGIKACDYTGNCLLGWDCDKDDYEEAHYSDLLA